MGFTETGPKDVTVSSSVPSARRRKDLVHRRNHTPNHTPSHLPPAPGAGSGLGKCGTRSRCRPLGACWRRNCHTPGGGSRLRYSGVSSGGTQLFRKHTSAPISAAVFLLGRSEPVPGNRRCASDALADGNPVAVGSSACEKWRALMIGGSTRPCATMSLFVYFGTLAPELESRSLQFLWTAGTQPVQGALRPAQQEAGAGLAQGKLVRRTA